MLYLIISLSVAFVLFLICGILFWIFRNNLNKIKMGIILILIVFAIAFIVAGVRLYFQ